MAAKDVHRKHIQEHLQELKDAISIGLEERPATIGFHTSACSIDLLELYLHVSGKVATGTVLKHDWFKRPKQGQKSLPLIERKLAVEFQEKNKLFNLMYQIEEERNKLIYGNASKSSINAALDAFQELHRTIKNQLIELGEDIE